MLARWVLGDLLLVEVRAPAGAVRHLKGTVLDRRRGGNDVVLPRYVIGAINNGLH